MIKTVSKVFAFIIAIGVFVWAFIYGVSSIISGIEANDPLIAMYGMGKAIIGGLICFILVYILDKVYWKGNQKTTK